MTNVQILSDDLTGLWYDDDRDASVYLSESSLRPLYASRRGISPFDDTDMDTESFLTTSQCPCNTPSGALNVAYEHDTTDWLPSLSESLYSFTNSTLDELDKIMQQVSESWHAPVNTDDRCEMVSDRVVGQEKRPGNENLQRTASLPYLPFRQRTTLGTRMPMGNRSNSYCTMTTIENNCTVRD